MWTFTAEKHIQLSINSGGITWYLAVKYGIVRLLPQQLSTAKERSFIWLPTLSANSRSMKSSRNRYDTHARGFPLIRPSDCELLEMQAYRQKSKIKDLSDENKRLQQEVARLKELTNTNKLISTSNPLTSTDAR